MKDCDCSNIDGRIDSNDAVINVDMEQFLDVVCAIR